MHRDAAEVGDVGAAFGFGCGSTTSNALADTGLLNGQGTSFIPCDEARNLFIEDVAEQHVRMLWHRDAQVPCPHCLKLWTVSK